MPIASPVRDIIVAVRGTSRSGDRRTKMTVYGLLPTTIARTPVHLSFATHICKEARGCLRGADLEGPRLFLWADLSTGPESLGQEADDLEPLQDRHYSGPVISALSDPWFAMCADV